MVSQAAIIEMLIRFYGAGAKRDFTDVLGVFIRKPYEAIREHLRRAVGRDLEDITDPNDETSFGFALDRYVLRLSMIGPYALLLKREDQSDQWTPVERAASELERELIEIARAHGFLVMGREELESIADLWGDEPATSLYHLLFVAEGEMPWPGQSQ
jgi:hypothetical protein